MVMASSSFSNSVSRGMKPEEDLQEKSKKFRSSNSWLERKRLENVLDETKTLLEEERVEKLGQLSQAEWVPSMQVAKVTKKVGRQWMTMGHSYLGDLILYPEEALFLLETNTIEIYYGGLPMSLQQAYSMLLGDDSTCTLEEYRAYAHLSRYGYRVRRHHLLQIRSRGERGEPPEVDVVGIICKVKSSENTSSEKSVQVENSVQVLKQEMPQKRSYTNGESCPSTSHTNSNQNLMSPEDDDITFIEVIDASKKRKVCGTIVIGDDVEITSKSANEESNSLGQNGASSNNKKVNLSGNGSKILKQETAEQSNNSLNISNCEDLVKNESVVSVNKPSRGMYKNEPFSTLSCDAEVCDSVPSSSAQDKVTNNFSRKGKVQNDNLSTAQKSKAGNDDIIVLSDDETKKESEQTKEIQRFYKEISLIELIDISEEDEDQKTTCLSHGKDRKVDDNYDFWGVLGRIPTLKKGRLVIVIPAPPSNLIPPNTRPVKDEYSIPMGTVEKQSEQPKEVIRPRDESYRPSDRGSGNHISQCHRIRSQEDTQYHRMEHQQVNPWNPWNSARSESNSFDQVQNTSSMFQSNLFSSNNYQTNHTRASWLSFVYPPRQTSHSFTQFQSWSSPSFSAYPQSHQYSAYSQQQFSNLNVYRGFRQQLRQENFRFSHDQGSTALWQRPSAPRTGNGYHRRGVRRPFSHNRGWNKYPKSVSVEVEKENTSVIPKNPDARSWSEIKVNGKSQEKVKSIDGSQTDRKEDILPLLKPADSISIDAVHSKLRLTSSAKFSCYDTSDRGTCPLSIKFDLYMPNSNFRKSCPGTPRYRLSVVKSNDSIPKLADVSYLMKSLNDEVPLLFAVGFPENINFFSFSNVDLPVQLTK